MKWFLFFYLISNGTFGESFSTNRVELKSHVLSSPFGVLREINGIRRYHAGVDYASTPPMEADFSAGVWGVLENINPSPFNTILVKPLHTMGYNIQYLHNTKRYSKDGDIVAPWTIIGRTNKTAPADEPVTDTHLHLQVWAITGNPQYPDWTRNYVNPETWDTGNPFKLPGDEKWAWKGGSIPREGYELTGFLYFKFDGDKIGDPVAFNSDITILRGGQFLCRMQGRFKGNIVRRKTNTFIARLVYQDCTPQAPCKCHGGSPEEHEFGLNRLGRVHWLNVPHIPQMIVSGGGYPEEEGIQQKSKKEFDPKDTIDLTIRISDPFKK